MGARRRGEQVTKRRLVSGRQPWLYVVLSALVLSMTSSWTSEPVAASPTPPPAMSSELPAGEDFSRAVALDNQGHAFISTANPMSSIIKWDVSGAVTVGSLTLSGAGRPSALLISEGVGYAVTDTPSPVLWKFNPVTLQVDDSKLISLPTPLSTFHQDMWTRVARVANRILVSFSDASTQVASFSAISFTQVGSLALPTASGFAMGMATYGSAAYLSMARLDGVAQASLLRLSVDPLAVTAEAPLQADEWYPQALAAGSDRVLLPVHESGRVAVFDSDTLTRLPDVSMGRTGRYSFAESDDTYGYFFQTSSWTMVRIKLADGSDPQSLSTVVVDAPSSNDFVVAMDLIGNRLVAVTGSSPVQVLDYALASFTLSSTSSLTSGLSSPKDLMVVDDSVWVVGERRNGGWIARLNSNSLSVEDSVALPAWRQPIGFAKIESGPIYVVARDPRSHIVEGFVLRIDPDTGSVTASLSIPKPSPWSVYSRRGDTLVVSDYTGSLLTVIDLPSMSIIGSLAPPADFEGLSSMALLTTGAVLLTSGRLAAAIDLGSQAEVARTQIAEEPAEQLAWQGPHGNDDIFITSDAGGVYRYDPATLELLDAYPAPEDAVGGYQEVTLDGRNAILIDAAGGYVAFDMGTGQFQPRLRLDDTGESLRVYGHGVDSTGHLYAVSDTSPARAWRTEAPGKAPGIPSVVGYRWSAASTLALDVMMFPGGGSGVSQFQVSYGRYSITENQVTSSSARIELPNVSPAFPLVVSVRAQNEFGSSPPGTWSYPGVTGAGFARVAMSMAASDVAMTSDSRKVFVAGSSLKVLRTFDDSVIGEFPISGQRLALAADDTTLLVGSGAEVKVVNAATGTVSRSIPTTASRLIVSRDGTRGYATNGGSVTAFDVTSGTVIGPVSVGHPIRGIAVSPDGQSVVVVSFTVPPGSPAGRLSVFDRDLNLVRQQDLSSFPLSPVVSPDSTQVYVAHFFQGQIRVYDLATLNTVRSVNASAESLIPFDNGRKLMANTFVMGTGGNSIVDTTTWQQVGTLPFWSSNLNVNGGALTNDGGKLYLASADSQLPWASGQVLVYRRAVLGQPTLQSAVTSGATTTFTWTHPATDIPPLWFGVSIDGGARTCRVLSSLEAPVNTCAVTDLSPGQHTAVLAPGDSTGLWATSSTLTFQVPTPSPVPDSPLPPGPAPPAPPASPSPSASPSPTATPSPTPTPTPEPSPSPEPTSDPSPVPLPSQPMPGSGVGLVGGIPDPNFRMTADADSGRVNLSGTGFRMTLTPPVPVGTPGAGGAMNLPANGPLQLAGSGFSPSGEVHVFMDPPTTPKSRMSGVGRQSPPRLLRSLVPTSAGAIAGTVKVPRDASLGPHTIQIVGRTLQGQELAVALGVNVVRAVSPTILIRGSRDSMRWPGYARVSGTTQGLDVRRVVPWVRLQGMAKFTKGSSDVPVKSNGSFTWKRKVSGPVRVYFTAAGVRSNIVTIPRVSARYSVVGPLLH
jgi:hypothetical protein